MDAKKNAIAMVKMCDIFYNSFGNAPVKGKTLSSTAIFEANQADEEVSSDDVKIIKKRSSPLSHEEAQEPFKSNSKKTVGSYLQGKKTLTHVDINFDKEFTRCSKSEDGKCKPIIQKNMWQDYDESVYEFIDGIKHYGLIKENAFMICRTGGGMIYASEDGQRISDLENLFADRFDELYGEIHAMVGSTSSTAMLNYMTRERQEANALYIYYYLSSPDIGWEKEAIAGLLGNLEQECVMNPGGWETMGKNGDGDDDYGYGLAQWTKAKEKFLKYAGLSKTQANDLATNDPCALMDLQLEYLLVTMQPGGGEWISSEAFVSNHYNAFSLNPSTPRLMDYSDYITSTIDSGQLALVFQAHYERSGDYETEPEEHRLKNRHDFAQAWYEFLKDY